MIAKAQIDGKAKISPVAHIFLTINNSHQALSLAVRSQSRVIFLPHFWCKVNLTPLPSAHFLKNHARIW